MVTNVNWSLKFCLSCQLKAIKYWSCVYIWMSASPSCAHCRRWINIWDFKMEPYKNGTVLCNYRFSFHVHQHCIFLVVKYKNEEWIEQNKSSTTYTFLQLVSNWSKSPSGNVWLDRLLRPTQKLNYDVTVEIHCDITGCMFTKTCFDDVWLSHWWWW